MRYEMDIFHYIELYKKHWKKMAFLIIVVMLAAAMLQSMQPITYRSTLIALSSKENSQGGNLGSYLGLPNLIMGASSNDIVFSMLKSRRMRRDINEHFQLSKRPKFWWNLDAYVVTGGFAVEVTGPDPKMTKEIGNFAVENLNKINLELQVTSQKPMVKVLDAAVEGSPAGRNVSKKVMASGLFAFLMCTLWIFFKEYFSQLKRSKK